ncbi:MAG: sigma-70 family RNA polymerase sigma factor [Candidatus Hydrogenedens sp.]|nr:sigma-70 family RNA polymerase sigma factor [Candidatus Hydrogenedens sp.]
MTDAMTIDEAAVLAAACAGDRTAFASLVKVYQRRAYAAAYGFTRNRDEAMDIAQDAFVKAYRAMDRFDPQMPFYPWLYRIIRNTALNHLKKKKRRGETSLDAMMEYGYDAQDESRTPEGEADLADLKSSLSDALECLTPDQREIIRLRHMLELSYTEIAQCLGIPQGTVMSRLHGARKALKAAVEQESNKAREAGVL